MSTTTVITNSITNKNRHFWPNGLPNHTKKWFY